MDPLCSEKTIVGTTKGSLSYSYTDQGLHAYDFRPHKYDFIAEVKVEVTEAEIQEMIG
jgi:hypothetical protein